MSIVAQSVALAAANQLHGLWGDDLDVEVDTSRVDRMAGTQSGSHTGGAMSIDELGGGEELWKLSDDEPSPPRSSKAKGKQTKPPSPSNPPSPAKSSKAPSKAPSKPPPSKPPPKPPPKSSRKEAKRTGAMLLSDDDDDEDMDVGGDLSPTVPKGGRASKKQRTPSPDALWTLEDDDIEDDPRFQEEEEEQPAKFVDESNEFQRIIMARGEEDRLGAETARNLADEERQRADDDADRERMEWMERPEPSTIGAERRKAQRAEARPVVLDHETEAPEAAPDPFLADDSDDEAESPTKRAAKGKGKGDKVMFSGAVPQRPTVDMVSKKTHAINLLDQMMPLGTGKFGKQTRAEREEAREARLLAPPRGETETVRGVLGTTEPHPRLGPRAEQIEALHQATWTPGARQAHETKHRMVREELMSSLAAEKRMHRMQYSAAVLDACADHSKSLAERARGADEAFRPSAAAPAAPQ